MDKHTISDLGVIIESVAGVFSRFPAVRAEDDTMVVRPLTVHSRTRYATVDHPEEVVRQIISLAGPDGSALPWAKAARLRLFLGFGLDRVAAGEYATYTDLLAAEYASRTTSLANGVFLTVGPDATVYPCTERNCAPAWALGNLKEQSVGEIYRGERRRKILARYDAARWGPELSQPTPRTSRLDRIAHAIHTGLLSDEMVAQVRDLSLRSHRLLLD